MYVLLQRYPDGYYSIQKAASNKHFDMIDKDFIEIDSGYYEDLVSLKRYLVLNDLIKNGKSVFYKNIKYNILCQTTIENFEIEINKDKDFLEKNKIIDYEQL